MNPLEHLWRPYFHVILCGPPDTIQFRIVAHISPSKFHLLTCKTPEFVSRLSRQAQYVIDNDFGGVMLYTLELDDTRNVCGLGKNSIGMAIKATLEAAVPSDTTTTELEAVQTTAAATAAPEM